MAQLITTAQTLTTGDVVTLSNMNDAGHNAPTVVTVVNATTFDCDDIAYVAGAGVSAGVVDEPSYLESGSGSAGEYLVNFSISGNSAVAAKNYKFEVFLGSTGQDKIVAESTPSGTAVQNSSGSGFITFTNGERIWLSITNRTDTTNFVMEHANINLHRI